MDQFITTSSEPAKPKDLSHHLSRVTKARPLSSIKRFYKYFGIPGIGQLAGGLPASAYFPYDTLEASVANPERWKPTSNDPVDPPPFKRLASASIDSKLPASRLLVPKDSGVADRNKKIDLVTALQYGTAQGYPPLYNFLLEFTRKHMHPNIPYAGGPDIVLTCGSTDGFSKCIQAFHDDWLEGRDPIETKSGLLVEKFCYMNATQTAQPKGVSIVPVEIDAEGMLADGPGGLEDVLKNWDNKKGKRPHLLYTVTMGQNPTSGVLSIPRRKALYKICSNYDVLIIEDDPYWYLQYPSATNFPHFTPSPTDKPTGFPFLDSLVPSYLSVDTDGRVLRLDTFSKTVAPGCRLGWITAQPTFIERLLRITETSTQQPSGFVQSMISELLMGPQTPSDPGRGGGKDGKGWDFSGWVRWLEGLRGNYERRMNTMSDIMEKGAEVVKTGRRKSLTGGGVLGDGDEEDEWAVVEKSKIYTFVRPMGGMFLWLHVNFQAHPLFTSSPSSTSPSTSKTKFSGPQLAQAFWILGTKPPYLVLSSPGAVFSPTNAIREELGWQYFRLCFAACEESELAPLSKRFVESAQAFWRLKAGEVRQLLEEAEVNEVGVLGGQGMEGVGEGVVEGRAFLGPCC